MIQTHADDLGHGRPLRPATVGVVGDGDAAWLTALALKEWRPELEVVVIPTREVANPAACISSTPSLLPFLFGWLGVDPLRFMRAVAPTIKLGTCFEWGLQTFASAFADGDVVDAQRHDGRSARYAVSAQLMAAGKGPFARVGGRDIPLVNDVRFGLQLDSARFIAFLAERARTVGVVATTAPLGDIEVEAGAIKRALSADGRVHRYDLWIDCSGAVSLLLGKALGVPRESYATSLPCDMVIAGITAASSAPHTTVGTLDAGWSWHVPLHDGARVGYVYSARFSEPGAALAELTARYPDLSAVHTKRFSPGRHRDCMSGNVVAIGEAYGEVEPLACSPLHMTVAAIMRLIVSLQSGDARRLNTTTAHQWDTLRWYLALHYRFNRRVDSPFWREVHIATDWTGMEPTVRDYLAQGPMSARDSVRDVTRELGVGSAELDVLMLGQGLVPEVLEPKTTLAEWHELMAMRESLVAVALPLAEASSALTDPAVWQGLVHDERSWCRQDAIALQRLCPGRGRSQDALAFWTRELGVPAVLGRDAGRMPDDFPTSPNIDFGKFMKRVPEVVLRPRDQAQLAECLQMCVRRRMPIRVRGAGHSSGGQALADEGAVIDLRWLKRIVAEAQTEERIRVEAGLWWIELCGYLRQSRRRPIVLTDNWRSTVGGTLAVGGFGDTTHREGLQIAGVRELVVMTLDGTRHRVRPGDDLFDWSLAGRGQLGIMTEVVLDTMERGYDLTARVLSWPSLDRFLDDARTITDEGRFDWLRARVTWAANAPVNAAAGHIGDVATEDLDDYVGLVATQGARDELDLYAKSAEAPDERWALASPGVEIVLPVDAKGIAAAHEIALRIQRSTLSRALPRGSSIMVLSTKHRRRFPLAPLPDSDLAMMIAIRPELPVADVPQFLPMLRGFADLALDAGGKVYLMSLEPTRPGWLRAQLGPERHDHLRALKAKWDPEGLLNAGLL